MRSQLPCGPRCAWVSGAGPAQATFQVLEGLTDRRVNKNHTVFRKIPGHEGSRLRRWDQGVMGTLVSHHGHNKWPPTSGPPLPRPWLVVYVSSLHWSHWPTCLTKDGCQVTSMTCLTIVTCLTSVTCCHIVPHSARLRPLQGDSQANSEGLPQM